MNARAETLIWVVQRLSAAMLAGAVAVHLATVLYAVRGGLKAADIIQRLHGSVGWMVFYALFVIAVALHAPIGLRTVFSELMGWRGRSLDLAMLALAVALLWLGLRAGIGLFL
ncbi:MAG: succinate dehydrogenase [Proteobacteria bacterium]|nr:succinate dehydrogenase [Pseudomonadota bacterium]